METCDIINNDSDDKTNVSKEELKQKSRKILKCPYDNCEKLFQKKFRLQTHIHSIHTGYTPFECPNDDCRASFACESYLKRHLKRHETSQNGNGKTKRKSSSSEYKCPECDDSTMMKLFRNKYELKLHLGKVHGQKPFKCNQCDQAFVLRSKLNAHQRRHRGYRCPFRSQSNDDNLDFGDNNNNDCCRGCQFQTDKWTELRKHIANQHKKLECTICRKTYSSAYNLRIHEQNVHKEKLPPDQENLENDNDHNQSSMFKCTIDNCDKSYQRLTSLQNHIRANHNEPKFQCQKCLKKFLYKKTLNSHMKRDNCCLDSDDPDKINDKKKQKSKRKSKSKLTNGKLNKILRIKPLIDEKQFNTDDDDDQFLLNFDDDGGDVNEGNEKIDLEKISESNLFA